MKAGSARAKGKRLEKLVADKIREAGLDDGARRMVLSGSAKGFESDIKTTLPFAIECKQQETWSPLKYMEQAKADGKKSGRIPVVVMGKNRLKEPLVVMELSDWLKILGGYNH